ncbi:glycosyltransferase family 2 protein [Desulfovibrio sp. OttesenSCG-928-I05]|nr:glycosyltransferase family 2 protein [Desulfovibrio sp. OttesenSCG-928-I05]
MREATPGANRLIAITIVRNEAGNFLRPWLENVAQLVDFHIFLDDGSDDATPDIIAGHLQKYPGLLFRRDVSLFKDNEPKLRGELWEYTRRIAREGDWIFIVDADEFVDEHFLDVKPQLLGNKFPHADIVKLSILDMWTASAYRCDGKWSPKHRSVRLIRYNDVPFGEEGTELHHPPYPASTNLSKKIKIYIPLFHFAYVRRKDRARRYQFYTRNVAQGTQAYAHALSIMEPDIRLKPFFTPWRLLWARVTGKKLQTGIYRQLKSLCEADDE